MHTILSFGKLQLEIDILAAGIVQDHHLSLIHIEMCIRDSAWIVPGGSLGTALPLFLLNFIIGGVIGGFVLVWRLLVAAWYIPLTIYRLWDCARKVPMQRSVYYEE